MTTLAALKLQRCGFGASRGRWAGDARIKAGTAAYALKDALKDIRPERFINERGLIYFSSCRNFLTHRD